MLYQTLKQAHIFFVYLSIAGFLLRGAWMIMNSRLLHHRLTRILPHVIDTLLVVSAISLSIMIAQYPFVAGWVTAKIIGLLVYIGLGVIALKRGRTLAIRLGAFVGAIAVYAWIISVAVTKQPSGFLPL